MKASVLVCCTATTSAIGTQMLPVSEALDVWPCSRTRKRTFKQDLSCLDDGPPSKALTACRSCKIKVLCTSLPGHCSQIGCSVEIRSFHAAEPPAYHCVIVEAQCRGNFALPPYTFLNIFSKSSPPSLDRNLVWHMPIKGHEQVDVHITKLLARFAAFVPGGSCEARSEEGSEKYHQLHNDGAISSWRTMLVRHEAEKANFFYRLAATRIFLFFGLDIMYTLFLQPRPRPVLLVLDKEAPVGNLQGRRAPQFKFEGLCLVYIFVPQQAILAWALSLMVGSNGFLTA